VHSEDEASHTKHLGMHGSTLHPTYNEKATLSQPVITSQALRWNLSTVPPTRMFWHVSGHYVFWFFCWWQLWGYFGSKRNIFSCAPNTIAKVGNIKNSKIVRFYSVCQSKVGFNMKKNTTWTGCWRQVRFEEMRFWWQAYTMKLKR